MARTPYTWFVVLSCAVALGACLPKEDDDKDESGWGFGTGRWGDVGVTSIADDDRDEDSYSEFRGRGGVLVVDAGCEVVWEISGYTCAGCDLGWEVDLSHSSASSCDFGSDTSGVFEVVGGAAYFNGDYWAAASAGGGALSWSTAGYVYGSGGGTYYYAGSGTY